MCEEDSDSKGVVNFEFYEGSLLECLRFATEWAENKRPNEQVFDLTFLVPWDEHAENHTVTLYWRTV